MKLWRSGHSGVGTGDANRRDEVERFERFTSSIANDRRLASYDIRASQAHAQALARAGVVTDQDAGQLVAALGDVARRIASGSLTFSDDLEDIHTHVEVALREIVGEAAGALHAGRSRNDQIATDLRLYTKDETYHAIALTLALEEALLDMATRSDGAIMPGYTHLQRGQPVLISHYLLAYVEMLERDRERFADSLARCDRCPLGSGALAGAGFALDRAFMARELGFNAVTLNSIDSVADRDFVVEFLTASAMLMVHLSRLAEDFIIWSTAEFGFVTLSDTMTSGSSMMPQKRNPDVLELVRGKCGLVIGNVTAALTLLKGLPMTYDRDLQEATTPLFGTADMLAECLSILVPLIRGACFDMRRCRDAAGNLALATDLADALVRAGVPFREAHHRVTLLVRDRLEAGKPLDDLSTHELAVALGLGDHHGRDGAIISAPDPELAGRLDPETSVRLRQTAGSTNPSMVANALDAARHRTAEQSGLWATRAEAFRAAIALR